MNLNVSTVKSEEGFGKEMAGDDSRCVKMLGIVASDTSR
jgi:hypothetical protein